MSPSSSEALTLPAPDGCITIPLLLFSTRNNPNLGEQFLNISLILGRMGPKGDGMRKGF